MQGSPPANDTMIAMVDLFFGFRQTVYATFANAHFFRHSTKLDLLRSAAGDGTVDGGYSLPEKTRQFGLRCS
jgi:hypothetical protein